MLRVEAKSCFAIVEFVKERDISYCSDISFVLYIASHVLHIFEFYDISRVYSVFLKL